MRQDLFDRVSVATVVLALMLSITNRLSWPQGQPSRAPSRPDSDRNVSDRHLPQIFTDVLPEVKAETHTAILLPDRLVNPIAKANHAIVEDANANGYAISLYYKLGIGDAGFAGSFSAQALPSYKLDELENVTKVKLAEGLGGFFKAVSCGGSCAPANLWWEQNGVVYQIQLKLPPSLSERSQREAIVNLADSCITGGPR
jgi:hypothetical protein